jgi:hypothetical protein
MWVWQEHLKTQEITFMHKKQPFLREDNKKFYAMISIKTKLLNHPFRYKNKTKE